MSLERPIGPSAETSTDGASVNGPAVEVAGSAGAGDAGPRRGRRSIRIPLPLPRTFQGRLSLAFVIVFAVAVGVVSGVTIFVLDRDLRQRDQVSLEARAKTAATSRTKPSCRPEAT